MIVIRTEQRHAVTERDREALVLAVCEHLRTSFGERLEPRDPDAQLGAVRAIVERAVSLGVVSRRDLCRLSNVAVMLGWGMLEQPANAWMIEGFLANERLGTPTQRVELLVDRCLRRMAVREHNAALRGG